MKRFGGEAYSTILKMKGYPSKSLKTRDDPKFPWGYPRMLLKTKYIEIFADYLIGDKWLDRSHSGGGKACSPFSFQGRGRAEAGKAGSRSLCELFNDLGARAALAARGSRR